MTNGAEHISLAGSQLGDRRHLCAFFSDDENRVLRPFMKDGFDRGEKAIHDDGVICTYQLRQCRGDTVIDIMRTRPMAVVGGILQRNPFYVPPEQIVLEQRERRARCGARRAATG